MTRTLRVVFARTFGRLAPSPSTAVALAGFLALAGGFFVRALFRGEGGTFNLRVYEAVLRANSLTPELFEAYLKRNPPKEGRNGNGQGGMPECP